MKGCQKTARHTHPAPQSFLSNSRGQKGTPPFKIPPGSQTALHRTILHPASRAPRFRQHARNGPMEPLPWVVSKPGLTFPVRPRTKAL
jgi:hypothetical protein